MNSTVINKNTPIPMSTAEQMNLLVDVLFLSSTNAQKQIQVVLLTHN